MATLGLSIEVYIFVDRASVSEKNNFPFVFQKLNKHNINIYIYTYIYPYTV